MQNLNEAVARLINEDVVNGKRLIENELYSRLGSMLEEKLKEFAPTVFSEPLVGKQKRLDKNNNNKLDKKDFDMLRNESVDQDDSDDDDLIMEEYEELLADLEQLVEEIEAETGEELTESEIEELADILLEEKESGVDPDEEEDYEDEEEDFEEDSEDDE
jgi:hypothetical protein